MRKTGFLIALLLPFTAQAISLVWPVQCELGKDCFVQNFVDHDASPAWRDYACGTSSYDKHDGTDIRLRNLQAMREGVNVLAAADGKVLRGRDGMEDASIRDKDPQTIKDRECGNGVVIEHAEGYRTMVCHLKKGSIAVQAGQAVKAGDKLGQVGLSGDTEFPHVHFTLWKGDEKIDPFTAKSIAKSCSKFDSKGLWKKPVPYAPTALLGDGFTDTVPEAKAMRDLPVSLTHASKSAPVLAYWVDLMGTRAGDRLTLTITQPGGGVLATVSQTLPKPQAVYFHFIGKRNRLSLPEGTYHASFTLKRGSKTLLQSAREVVVE